MPRLAPAAVAALALALGALALALAACGGDDEEERAAGTSTPPAREDTAPATTGESRTRTAEEPVETGEEPPPPATSPEDQPGGAGDEEPARSLALLTCEGGRITPRVVRVPPFIAIRVELRSADGEPCGLQVHGEAIEVSDGLGSASATVDGLRPGQSLVGVPTAGGSRVRIVASAEPGP